ncbi:hypothetical protein TcYC6_0024490 [Trypanosoma cruzi]|nr:hypothetical protein TcYC6_0024490 [Trypanosoma cruzi]
MALFSFYTTFEWSDIVARLPELVRQNGAVQVQLTFIDENGPSDATLTAATFMTGLRLILGNIAKPWEDSGPTGHFANLRAPQVPNFETQVLLPIVWARPGSWGSIKGTSLLKGLFSTEYARAIADVQNRGAQLYSQVEEARDNLSERESHIALTDGLLAERECALAGREQQLEAVNAQLQEREARISAKEAQRAAWEAETADREEVSTSRRGLTDGPVTCHNKAEDGVTKQPH